LSYVTFIRLNMSFIPTFFRVIIMRGCGFCQSLSLHLLRWLGNFLFLILLMCYIIFIYFCILNYSCTPWMKPTWSFCMIFSKCGWIFFCKYYIKNFCMHVHQNNCSLIFYCCVLIQLSYDSNTDFVEWI
jgi:hypothetical protein